MWQAMAPVAGLIAKISVKEGQVVERGQIVAFVQCMKTEIPVVAEDGGVVRSIRVEEGDEVELGDVILDVC
ncbi:MAG: acetyl-CoA carboxylase biotin carboxyl carrier protein subunit [Clostridia bacterium]|jgi:biotin carboxyl carrier protein|nr:acetyl-CoA carboxylase biotin carboxyl carrier protein subunit [Clostridia bacterium]MDH7573754.1 acetyl-CoA carboxylase biotin carboxyl carrier protein subunit [Clostridia bacterium]